MPTIDDKLIFEEYNNRLYFTTLHKHEDEIILYSSKWYIPRIKAFYKFHPLDPVGKGVIWSGHPDDYYGIITNEMNVIIHDKKRIHARLIYVNTPENLQKYGKIVAELPPDGRSLLDI